MPLSLEEPRSSRAPRRMLDCFDRPPRSLPKLKASKQRLRTLRMLSDVCPIPRLGNAARMQSGGAVKLVLKTSKRRALASVSVAAALIAGTAHAQSPAANPDPLPPITVQEPQARPQQRTTASRPARAGRVAVRRASQRQQATAPQPASRTAPATSTMSVQPAFAGGQVARGGQVGVLGNLDYMSAPFSTQSFTQQFIENQQATSHPGRAARTIPRSPRRRAGRAGPSIMSGSGGSPPTPAPSRAPSMASPVSPDICCLRRNSCSGSN